MKKFLIAIAIIALAILAFNSCDSKHVPCKHCGAEVDAKYVEICANEGYTPLCEDCR